MSWANVRYAGDIWGTRSKNIITPIGWHQSGSWTRVKGKLYRDIGEDKRQIESRMWTSWLLPWEVSPGTLLKATVPLTGASTTEFLLTALVTSAASRHAILSFPVLWWWWWWWVKLQLWAPEPCLLLFLHPHLHTQDSQTSLTLSQCECSLSFFWGSWYTQRSIWGLWRDTSIGIHAIICWNIFSPCLQTFNTGRKQNQPTPFTPQPLGQK